MVKHAMLDLETLSTESNAVVLTIGGCKFNPFNNDEPFEKSGNGNIKKPPIKPNIIDK